MIKEDGFLAPGLTLFGDNAYPSSRYMATPFKSVSNGPKDAYNFSQSQVRIQIECAFGKLVHRWGILRRMMPYNINEFSRFVFVQTPEFLHRSEGSPGPGFYGTGRRGSSFEGRVSNLFRVLTLMTFDLRNYWVEGTILKIIAIRFYGNIGARPRSRRMRVIFYYSK